MFVQAGRMGNMAADVQAGSKPEVRATLLRPHLLSTRGGGVVESSGHLYMGSAITKMTTAVLFCYKWSCSVCSLIAL